MSVYFVTCREANAVKIGCSGDPHGRVSQIQWGCPLSVKLEAVLPGRFDEEAAFHSRFADDRLTGEWFRITPMIEAIIAANPAPPPERAPEVNRYYRPPSHQENLVARVRAQLQLTQVELAARVGIEAKDLRKYEGKWKPGKAPPPEIEAKLNALRAAAIAVGEGK